MPQGEPPELNIPEGYYVTIPLNTEHSMSVLQEMSDEEKNNGQNSKHISDEKLKVANAVIELPEDAFKIQSV